MYTTPIWKYAYRFSFVLNQTPFSSDRVYRSRDSAFVFGSIYVSINLTKIDRFDFRTKLKWLTF